MKEEFFYWLTDIQEGEPLPYEINYIYFCVHKENGDAYFAYYGSENFQEIALNFEYFPLDGQYFYHKDIEGGDEFHKLRFLVEKYVASENGKFLRDKKIYIAEFGKKVLFEFYQ